MHKIRTERVFPPIPVREFDWSAQFEEDDGDGVHGFGRTEQEAINDLLENYPRD